MRRVTAPGNHPNNNNNNNNNNNRHPQKIRYRHSSLDSLGWTRMLIIVTCQCE